MTAIIASGANQVRLDEAQAEPDPAPGEVIVRIAAAPIQPSDRLNIMGNFSHTRFPIIPGRDYAGTVVGPESSPWCGKRVYGTSGRDLGMTRNGAHAEFITLPEYVLAEIPHNLSFLQAALIGTPWTTALLTLKRTLAKTGETIAVIGAGGNVGSAVVELAKSSSFGCKVLRVGRGQQYDINLTIDPKLRGLSENTGGKGIDIVIDTTGDLALVSAALKNLGCKGRVAIITTGSSNGSNATALNIDLKVLYRLEQSVIGCNSVEHDPCDTPAWMNELSRGFISGELTPPRSDSPRLAMIGLSDAVNAYAELERGSRKVFVILPHTES